MAAIPTTPFSYESKDSATKYTAKDGDTLASIVTANAETFATWQHLAMYNWGTSEPLEVNRALLETIGCSAVDAKDPSKSVLKVHPDAKNTPILLAKPWSAAGLSTGKTYVVQATKPKPPTAISIGHLDRWFIPGKETCDVKYVLEGSKACAKKVVFEVYGSNYSAPGDWNKGLGKFPAAADKKDIALFTKERDDAPERLTLFIVDWNGTVTATEGALGTKTPKTGGGTEDRVVNVAFSPYTAHVRYFLDDADKKARVVLEPFWPLFDAANAPASASLKIHWNVKDTTRFEGGKGSGQLLVIDCAGKVVFRKPLKDDEMKTKASGTHEFVWASGTYNEPGALNSKGGAVAISEDMPYRVQIQMHTVAGEAKGVAVAAMHTEVRLYVHPNTLKRDVDPYDPTTDKNSIRIGCATDLLVTKPVTRADGTIWCKEQLAKGGFHPGPVNADAAHAAYKIALEEFKRSIPKRKALPADDFARFTIDATEGDDVKDALEDLTKIPDWQRPWFGDPAAARADLALPAAVTNLNDVAKEVILWVDDRHTYTDPDWLASTAQGPAVRNKVKGSAPATKNHMGSYLGGDAMIDLKTKSIPRPWIPLAADLPLMGKDANLNAVLPLPAEADLVFMRKAIGPLRVDWTFDEIDANPPDEATVDVATGYDKRVTRTRAYSRNALQAGKAEVTRKDVKKKSIYHNCPTAAGGIRPAAGYYKAPFAMGNDSLRPWAPIDVAARESVATIVHDNLGQTGDDLVVSRLGQAGVFFHPSTMGGDGYRVRAQVQFTAQGDYKLPNVDVLKARYPLLPQTQSASVRIWRKASVRAYVCWSSNNDWAASHDATFKIFEPGYLHFVYERGDAAVNGKITDWFADDATFRSTVKEALKPGATPTSPDGKRGLDANIKLTDKRIWPWYKDPGYGLFEASAPNATMAAARDALVANPISPLFFTLSNLFGLSFVDSIEKKKGKLRGHVIVQMLTSDKFYMQQYLCAVCHKKYYYAEAKKSGGSRKGLACPTPACAGTLAQQGPKYHGYYTCTNGHAHDWDEPAAGIPNGGGFSGFNCTTTNCGGGAPAPVGTLNPDQVKREQYKCTACAFTGWYEEAGAGGSHDGESCPAANCAGTLTHMGGVFKERYVCTVCAVVDEQVEPAAAGGTHVGIPHATCAQTPKGVLKRKVPVDVTETHTFANGNKVDIVSTEESGFDDLPAPSLGNPLGVAWNFSGSPELWAHESGHCRHMEHAGNAPGFNNAQHDPVANSTFAWATINETVAVGKHWDRACLMTYASHRANYDPVRDKCYPCGKCSLKIRGWKLAGVSAPGGAVKDP